MPQILVFSFSHITLEFSIHNCFKTRMLLEIFDAEFPYTLSYFEPLCLMNKMAAKTVKRAIVCGCSVPLHSVVGGDLYFILGKLWDCITQ